MKMRYLAIAGSIAYLVSICYALTTNGYKGNIAAGIAAIILIPVYHLGFNHLAARLPKFSLSYQRYNRATTVWLVVASVVHFCSAIFLQNNPQASAYAIVPLLGLLCVFMVMFSQETN